MKKKDATWVVSNCNSKHRQNLVAKLQKYIDIDIYGECGTLKCDKKSRDCTNLESKYRFYFAFENCLCVDYITEKVFKVLTFFVIPVVFNGADMKRFLPPKSVEL